MFENLRAASINRLLRTHSWALERLLPHAGKTIVLVCAPVELRLTVCANGEVTAAPPHTPEDARIAVSPGVLLRLLARDEAAWSAVEVTGDVHFAAAVDYLWRNLSWDYEEDLSRLVGDIPAHRIARGLRELDRWGRSAALNLGHALAEYVTHEQPSLASPFAVQDFVRDVDEVRDDVERLAKRIELVRRRIG
ncbi:MAG TPA: sterol-binding protein [Burkholderiales bacterium]|nr:sterol-binding protein [Burkholderiales bacterium]